MQGYCEKDKRTEFKTNNFHKSNKKYMLNCFLTNFMNNPGSKYNVIFQTKVTMINVGGGFYDKE